MSMTTIGNNLLNAALKYDNIQNKPNKASFVTLVIQQTKADRHNTRTNLTLFNATLNHDLSLERTMYNRFYCYRIYKSIRVIRIKNRNARIDLCITLYGNNYRRIRALRSDGEIVMSIRKLYVCLSNGSIIYFPSVTVRKTFGGNWFWCDYVKYVIDEVTEQTLGKLNCFPINCLSNG